MFVVVAAVLVAAEEDVCVPTIGVLAVVVALDKVGRGSAEPKGAVLMTPMLKVSVAPSL